MFLLHFATLLCIFKQKFIIQKKTSKKKEKKRKKEDISFKALLKEERKEKILKLNLNMICN